MPRALAVAGWRAWTALFTTLTFVVLLSTAVTHHHATTDADRDCSVCGVVTHKLADLPMAKLPSLVMVFVSYVPYALVNTGVVPASPTLLPPSCGPPYLPPAAC